MKSGSGYTIDHQKTWRRIASVCLLLSAAMAVYAVSSTMARDTLIHVARSAAESRMDLVPTIPAWACLLFWVVFGLLLLVTSYIALLDMRFIRLQYALEKRALLQESWGDDEFRDMLRKTQEKHKNIESRDATEDSAKS